MKRLVGLGASAGRAVGEAVRLDSGSSAPRYLVAEDEVADALQRLSSSIERSRDQLRAVRRRVGAIGSGRAALFDAQLLMLDDPMLVGRARDLVRERHLDPAWALAEAARQLESLFDGIDDDYLRERSGDVADVVGRVQANLGSVEGRPEDLLPDRPGPFVLVAEDLAASLVAQLDVTRVAGLALGTGSWTYHTAILARSLGVPCVCGLGAALQSVRPGSMLAIDGGAGTLIVDPALGDAPGTCAAGARPELRATPNRQAEPAASYQSSNTTDGRLIVLEANVERLADVPDALAGGAAGIGLYRSEYLLAGAAVDGISEDAQFETYRALLEGMGGRPVTIRTFDLGAVLGRPSDASAVAVPGTGLHGIRWSLRRPDLLERQFRALLRAAAHGDLRILLPFVTEPAEIESARRVLDDARRRVRVRGERPPPVPVGAMVETPAAALTVDLLARGADFFSVGTNDLVQHCVAADRRDADTGRLHDPAHPAVVRLMRSVVRLARRRRLPVSVCGEMVTDPVGLTLVIGSGITSISMRPGALAEARRRIARLSAEDARHVSRRLVRGEPLDVIRAAVTSGSLTQPSAAASRR